MKAFVIREKHDASVRDTPPPVPSGGEALVRVRACGICGSDLHAYEGRQPFFQYPNTPGHEVVGDVVELIPRPGGPMRLPSRPIEEDLSVGERVVLDPGMPCGTCHACTHGRYNCCENMRVIGVHAPGAFAEFYAAPAECLHRVSDGMSDELACLVEPLSIGVQANNRGRVTEEGTVLVIGAGTIGLCVMLVARSRGAKVAMTDLSAPRRKKALEMGANAAFDPRDATFAADLADFCQGGSPSVVVEAVGTPATAAQALDLAVAGGRVVLVGLISDDISFPGSIMVRKELDFRGCRLHGGTVPAAVRLVAEGKADVASLITHRLGLPETEAALRSMAESPDDILKAVVTIGGKS